MLEFFLTYAHWYPWILFGALLLAGCNVPISIDVLLVATAFIAATLFPEKTILFFVVFTTGAIIAAWIAYWIGRGVGGRFNKLAPEKMEKIQAIYTKWGGWMFIVGRFIPFGVRNALYMFSGFSKIPFGRFVLWDGIACTCWSSLLFFTFYRLGQNYERLLSHIKIMNICIFSAFAVAVIVLICYKLKSKKKVVP